jgi:hypothetical protein
LGSNKAKEYFIKYNRNQNYYSKQKSKKSNLNKEGLQKLGKEIEQYFYLID